MQSKNKRAGIHDVARVAGVSPATVSRVLNATGYPVSEEASQKVREAAVRLDYTPNQLGRMLKKNENKMIGIVVPTIANPFYSQIVIGIETEARRRGYGALLCNTLRDEEEENNCIQSLFDKQVMGIAISSVAENHALIRSLQKKGLKVVLIDQDAPDLDCVRIGYNIIKGGIIAAEHLIGRGHKNAAFLSSPLNRRSRIELLEGFRAGHAMHGMDLKPENVILDDAESESTEGIYEIECGKRLAARLLDRNDRPTAVFAANDMIAIGVMQQLAASGLTVPDDISVIGFDNIFLSSVVNPPLTTIDQPSTGTGRLVCQLLIGMIEGNTADPLAVSLEPKLVERKSVKNLI